MANKLTVLAAIAALVILLAAGLDAQDRYARAALAIHIDWIQPQYGQHAINGEALIHSDVPLDIEVGLVNPFQGARAGAELDWPNMIRVSLHKGGRFQQNRQLVAPFNCDIAQVSDRSKAFTASDRTVILLADDSQVFHHCSIDTADLPAGAYTVQAEWIAGTAEDETIKTLAVSREIAILQVELRKVESEEDALDRSLQLASRAVRRGDAALAESVAAEVLRADPRSTFALMIRGYAKKAAGSCLDAQRDWRRMADLLETDVNPRSRELAQRSVQDRRRSAQEWREKARQLGCR